MPVRTRCAQPRPVLDITDRPAFAYLDRLIEAGLGDIPQDSLWKMTVTGVRCPDCSEATWCSHRQAFAELPYLSAVNPEARL